MEFLPEQTGFPHDVEHHDPVPGADSRRPLSIAWISDELIEETRRVWSPMYGRAISADEAVEILMIVKRFAEVLLRAGQQERSRR